MDAKRVDPVKDGELANIFARYGFHSLSLGSRARGLARWGSDYDITVLFKLNNVTIVDEEELKSWGRKCI